MSLKKIGTALFAVTKFAKFFPVTFYEQKRCQNFSSKVSMTISRQQQLVKYCTHKFSCWCCKAPRENELFCSMCSSIQRPLPPLDYFELFNIDKIFEIDDKVLNHNFKRLQMILHPDKFSMKSKDEQTIAEEVSAVVNEAYSTLRYPLSRGIYMLECHDIYIGEKSSVKDPEFLMEVMELNEAVEVANSCEDLKKTDQECKAVIANTISSINDSFKNNKLHEAQELLIKLRYYLNITSKISERLLEFGSV